MGLDKFCELDNLLIGLRICFLDLFLLIGLDCFSNGFFYFGIDGFQFINESGIWRLGLIYLIGLKFVNGLKTRKD